MINELQTLMDFHSISSDQYAVGELLDYVEKRVEERGLYVERIEYSGVKSPPR